MKYSTKNYLSEGSDLINKAKAILNYTRQPNVLLSFDEIKKLIADIESLSAKLRDVEVPQNFDQLFESELKRRLFAESMDLLANISNEVLPWEQLVASYGVPMEDLEDLEKWLGENINQVRDANLRHFKNNNDLADRTYLRHYTGIEKKVAEGEKLVNRKVKILINTIKECFGDESGVNLALSEYTFFVDKNEQRSYISTIARIIAVCSSDLVYFNGNKIYLDEDELLSIIGHEFFGHARHFVLTESTKDLPEFLRIRTDNGVVASLESISQYFEKKFFDWLADNQEAQKKLKLKKSFESVYKEYIDKLCIGEYRRKRYRYAIYTLARSGQAKWRDNIDAIRKYSLEPFWFTNFINQHKYDWDEITGRLNPRTVRELIYAADPVKRIMAKVSDNHIKEVERLVLTGYWTPKGMEDWVRLKLEASKS